MKRLPDSELECMLIIWSFNRPVTRMEIQEQMSPERNLSSTALLSFLSRLEEKGYLKVEKEKKTNYYTAIISEQEYKKKESRSILQKVYQNSIKNFVAALYDGDSLSDEDLQELQDFINEKSRK